jgi:hypothetical protein
MFDFLKDDSGASKGPGPMYLRGVALHMWDTGDWIEIWRAPSAAVPWLSPI